MFNQEINLNLRITTLFPSGILQQKYRALSLLTEFLFLIKTRTAVFIQIYLSTVRDLPLLLYVNSLDTVDDGLCRIQEEEVINNVRKAGSSTSCINVCRAEPATKNLKGQEAAV